MRKFLKYLYEISVLPLAYVTPLICLPVLPFHPLTNVVIGVLVSVLVVFLFSQSYRRN